MNRWTSFRRFQIFPTAKGFSWDTRLLTLTRTRTLETVWPEEWSKTSKKRTNLVVRRTEMFSDHRITSKPVSAQHASLFCKAALMLVSLSATVGVLSGLALLQINETVYLLSVYRQAAQQGYLGNKCIYPMLDCSEQDPASHRLRVGCSHGRLSDWRTCGSCATGWSSGTFASPSPVCA